MFASSMLVGVHIPRFALAVTVAAGGGGPVGAPAAVAPGEGSGGRIGEVNAPAEAAGVRAGMRASEALALCPPLALHPPDPVAVRVAAERMCRGLEAAGAGVEPVADGLVLLDSRPLRRLLGGLDGVLREVGRAAAAAAPGPRPRLGAGTVRFVALTAARRARPGAPLVVGATSAQAFLDRLPLSALEPVAVEVREALHDAGLRRLQDVRALGRTALRDRFGPGGERAWLLSAGIDVERVRARPLPIALREVLALPEPAATEQALTHALRLLLDRLLARPEREGRAPRLVLLGARLAGGGSWERQVALREATSERARLELALLPRLQELPGPVDQLAVELGVLSEADHQLALVRAAGEERRERVAEAVRQVRAAVGPGAALRVVEVDSTSRLPERRFGLAPPESA